MTAKAWPASLLPSLVAFEQDVPSKSGGLTLTGDEQVTQSSAGRWRARLTIPVGRIVGASPWQRLLDARAIKAYCQGRGNAVLIGPYDQANTPAAIAGVASAVINAAATANAGATVVRVTAASLSYQPRPGQYFGAGGNRLYMIQTDGVAIVSTIGNLRTYDLTIWPTLRATILNGSTLEWGNPVCQMRLATDDSFALDLGTNYSGEGSVELVEDFRP